jgi:type II secretory pathway component PulJ
MKRSFPCSPTGRVHGPAGYTLVEILVAATISLVLMLLVVNIVGTVGSSISNSRAALEMSNRLREAHARLTQDLQGITVTMSPPRDPAANEGYFEYTEGPAGPDFEPSQAAYNLNDASNPIQGDTTVGDIDDMILFTTRNKTQPFVGKLKGTETIQSPDAEVAWFVRGRTLYRRVLLVAPQCLNQLSAGASMSESEWGGGSFFKNNDISVRRITDGTNVYLVPNTLGDLTKPENRYAHQPNSGDYPAGYPYHPHLIANWATLKLPLLAETASANWFTQWSYGYDPPTPPPVPVPKPNALLPAITLNYNSAPYDLFDAWTNPIRYQDLDRITGAITDMSDSDRGGEDVVLTNVIGFDVKVWDPDAPILQYLSGGNPVGPALLPGDPGYWAALQAYVAGGASAPGLIGQGAYVDLGYAREIYSSSMVSNFSHKGVPGSKLVELAKDPSTGFYERVYDTWSTHFESNSYDENNDTVADAATNGFDDDSNGVVDDAGERDTSPPYPVPLRGLQVKIRIFEPDSRQIREVTVVQKF